MTFLAADDTVSDAAEPSSFSSPEFIDPEPALNEAWELEDIPEEKPAQAQTKPVRPKVSAPNADEWMKFLSDIILKVGTEWYVDLAFRGIEDELLSDREVESMRLSKTERDEIAKPISEFINKTKLGKKHGRLIISSADSLNSLIILGRWFSRVNRISRRYRPKVSKPAREHTNGNAGPVSPNGHGDSEFLAGSVIYPSTGRG